MIRLAEDWNNNISNNQFELLSVNYALNAYKTKGLLSWTYSPFKNYRKTDGNIDFLTTKDLNFNINNPVEMIALPSYDGSVNIIFTDNNNIPKLINSRFSVRGNNSYEIVDRIGENDTNLYDADKFELQTSLLKLYNNIPTVDFIGETMSGNLKVGNYIFYFSYCDTDGNETDIITESGIISIFKGLNKIPFNIDGGTRDLNSYKAILLKLTNIDQEYSYVKVYYTRYSADIYEHSSSNTFSIILKYPIKDGRCDININGFENQYEISDSQINTSYSNINSVKTIASVLNRLFLGNIELLSPEFNELKDLSLRILPYYEVHDREKLIGNLDLNYIDISDEGRYGYYNSDNIYNYVGYAPNELYRFGIVYILKDNSLSPVFNIRGINGIPNINDASKYTLCPLYLNDSEEENYNDQKRKYIDCIDEATYEFIGSTNHENSKGVITINDVDELKIYSIKFKFEEEKVLTELNKYIKGYFFVRQKRIPLSLGQALILPIEKETSLPAIPCGNDLMESFMDKERLIVNDYMSRLLEIKQNRNNTQAALIFPEYEINQALYNSILTGGDFFVKELSYNNTIKDLTRDIVNNRHYYISEFKKIDNPKEYHCKLIQVADNTKAVGIDDIKFSARAGEAEEGFRYEKPDNVINGEAPITESEKSINYIRGSYGPYVGMTCDLNINFAKLVDVYIPGYSITQYNNYFKIRYDDQSNYYAVSDRYNITSVNDFEKINIFRGDSYICNFTHRLNRNFNDVTTPIGDTIIDKKTWKDKFKVKDGAVDKDRFSSINLGDLNAVQLGSWITIKVRCSKNLSLRSQDTSLPDEAALFGHNRSFYPLAPMSTLGPYKLPESDVFNAAFSKTSSIKQYVLLPDVPYYRNSFQTTIYYSDIYINDAYINGYRKILESQHYNYETHYGQIIKLVPFGADLLCVFEHGITLLLINLKTPISQSEDVPIYISAETVLPKTMQVISDTIGSLWLDSIIKTDKAVYGVDTNAKKIWKYNSSGLIIISDLTILLFLNRNITLSEHELTPIIGIKNIKSHYNKNKGDVMFTYYDDISSTEERIWNICFNEILNLWTTFYSWVPSFSVNIYNNYFSFNREDSKYGSLLDPSPNCIKLESNSIKLDGNKIDENMSIPISINEFDDNYTLNTELIRDIYGFYKYFNITDNKLRFNRDCNIDDIINIMKEYNLPIILLNINVTLKKSNTSYEDLISNATISKKLNNITVGLNIPYKKEKKEEKGIPLVQSWFWSHGKTGIFDIKNPISPTKWYGKQHPFELEFVVNDKISFHKIFDSLLIIGNNAEPESFHYEIVGDSYSFANDKENMYYRLEQTKELLLNNHINVSFDPNYKDTKIKQRKISGTDKYDKSTAFPLYYGRQDKLSTIEDYYHSYIQEENSKDFSMLAGAEIVKNSRSNEYNIWNHVKAIDIKNNNRLRGNMNYLEDKWCVLINPINLILKNENKWNEPPVVIDTIDSYKNELDAGKVKYTEWNSENKEVKIKDKWMKVRIRYSGEKLTILRAINTFYDISKA